MAFRMSAVRNLRFDENLPLYGWQEDVDFAGQLLMKGRIVKTNAFSGVHRGVTRGRTPGVALGFSQIVNPIYLVNKGTMRRTKALKLMAKNLIANHLRSVRPEAFIDPRRAHAGQLARAFAPGVREIRPRRNIAALMRRASTGAVLRSKAAAVQRKRRANKVQELAPARPNQCLLSELSSGRFNLSH